MGGRPFLFMTARSLGFPRSSAAAVRYLRVRLLGGFLSCVSCVHRLLLCARRGGATSIAPRAALRSAGHVCVVGWGCAAAAFHVVARICYAPPSSLPLHSSPSPSFYILKAIAEPWVLGG